MYKHIKDTFYFTLSINNDIYFFEQLEKYIKSKLMISRVKPNTLKTMLSTLKIFIYWSMANPVREKEELCFYLARFLESEENGFKIYNKIYVEDLDEEIEYLEIDVAPKENSTIDKDKVIIEEYLRFTNQDLFTTFDLNKNIKAYNSTKKFAKGYDYGLKMGKISQSVFLNEESLIPKRNKTVKNDIKAFPYQLYERLLEIARPRERLIYLLSGSCSARISQALNLTLYDIDYDRKMVWLIDPNTNNQLGCTGIGRKLFLKENYNIDTSQDKAHINFGFKAPIPLHFKKRAHLFWVSTRYKELFFSTLPKYSFLPESSRLPRHPFFFITKTGKRLSTQQVNTIFKKHCEVLKEEFPEYSIQLDNLGLHSLRHMFGTIMATIQAHLILDKNNISNITPEHIKIITQEAMGHKNIASTNIYFNRPWSLDIQLGEFLTEIYTQTINDFSKIKRGNPDGYRFTK